MFNRNRLPSLRFLRLDSSGKSPAYAHRQRNQRVAETTRGFFYDGLVHERFLITGFFNRQGFPSGFSIQRELNLHPSPPFDLDA
jgi:hypothetical protein